MAENTIIHEIRLAGYKATSTGGMLDLGTWGSYGIEKLHLTLDAAWQDLTITAFFNVNGEVVAKRVVGKDGYADVPWEATKENTFSGCLAFEGSINGQRRISTNLNYKVTNHSETTDSDPVPTDDRWNQFVTETKGYRDGAFEAAERANTRAEDAEAASEGAQAAARAAKASENAAAASASNAAADAAKAGPYAKAAQAAQEAAENAAAAAADSKSAADTLAAEAARAALAAENSKVAANNAANLAGEDATAAQQAADTATAAANDAGQSASGAAASKAAAETAAKAAQNAQTATAAAKAEAVKAQVAAQTAAKSAQDAQAAAEKIRDEAKAAQKGAEAARNAATKSAEDAAKSEAKAKQSADTLAESVENVVANTAAVAELKEKKAEIDDTAVGANAWSSKHIIDMLCPPLEESGNPIVCYPVAGYPLGVKASWEPMQEGTGTPYPAGGGPNKLNVAGIVSNRTISGITFTVNADGTIGVNGTSTAICFLNPNTKFNKSYLQKIPAGTYRLDFAQTALSIFLFGYYEDGSETPIVYAGNVVTYAQDAYVAPQIRVAADVTVNTTARLMLHTGTSTPSTYAGWENIRPIKGRDSVKVERCGKNLWSLGNVGFRQYKEISTNYPAGKYVLSYEIETESTNDNIQVGWFIDGEWKYLHKQKDKRIIIVMSASVGISGFRFYAGSSSTDQSNATYKNIQLEIGDSATTYTPYIGQTTPLTLPETVYGGEVDAVSGDGNNNTKVITLDGNELKFRQANIYYNLPMHSAPGIAKNGVVGCSHFNRRLFAVNTNYEFCFVLASDAAGLFANIDELNAYLAAQYAAGTPVQIAYKLAEPVPFTATGAQPLPALAGANTVLTDADSATVTGRADPIKRITDLEDAVASQT